MDRVALGKWGESLAAAYYQKNGYVLLARNFRCAHGELDLICSRKNTLYIIEVKTRQSSTFGYPEEAVTEKKFKRMQRCAAAYRETSNRVYSEMVFHVCAVYRGYHHVTIRLYTQLL